MTIDDSEVATQMELAYLVYLNSAVSARSPGPRCWFPAGAAVEASRRLRELLTRQLVGRVILSAKLCPSAGGSS